MMTMAINERPIWYALYDRSETITDAYGNEVDTRVVYKTPVKMFANVSEATGNSRVQPFGNLPDYDRVIVTDWMECPIDEDTVLCVDCEPSYTPPSASSSTVTTASTPGDETSSCDLIYDYVVRRVSRSLNHVAIAIAKVKKD